VPIDTDEEIRDITPQYRQLRREMYPSSTPGYLRSRYGQILSNVKKNFEKRISVLEWLLENVDNETQVEKEESEKIAQRKSRGNTKIIKNSGNVIRRNTGPVGNNSVEITYNSGRKRQYEFSNSSPRKKSFHKVKEVTEDDETFEENEKSTSFQNFNLLGEDDETIEKNEKRTSFEKDCITDLQNFNVLEEDSVHKEELLHNPQKDDILNINNEDDHKQLKDSEDDHSLTLPEDEDVLFSRTVSLFRRNSSLWIEPATEEKILFVVLKGKDVYSLCGVDGKRSILFCKTVTEEFFIRSYDSTTIEWAENGTCETFGIRFSAPTDKKKFLVVLNDIRSRIIELFF
jgi:hypothetical protein